MKTISERIKEGLEIRKMKQADLVELTGIGKSSISTYISGAYEPKQRNIYKIAKALNVNEAWLMGHDVAMEKACSDTDSKVIVTAESSVLLDIFNQCSNVGQKRIIEYSKKILALEKDENAIDYLTPIAAHNDNMSDEQLLLIKKDLEKF